MFQNLYPISSLKLLLLSRNVNNHQFSSTVISSFILFSFIATNKFLIAGKFRRRRRLQLVLIMKEVEQERHKKMFILRSMGFPITTGNRSRKGKTVRSHKSKPFIILWKTTFEHVFLNYSGLCISEIVPLADGDHPSIYTNL